jgi:hypothetical protein
VYKIIELVLVNITFRGIAQTITVKFYNQNLKFMNAKNRIRTSVIGAIMMFYTGFNYVTTERL